ncbi:MAG: serine/threonine-protein phosphatase [Actinobacteria bacterium]|nr:serine/threonine-protein phosphatase [Actinomycetota bacterium]
MIVEVTASHETEPQTGFTDRDEGRPTAESVGERLLGALLDRVHMIAPRLVGQLIAQEAQLAGVTDVSIHLQDLAQVTLRPLTGPGLVGDPLPIDASLAGQAFATEQSVEEPLPDGSVRLHLPMLDGSDRLGVLGLTLPRLDDHDRQLAQRLAGLVADMIVTNDNYTDAFFRVRTVGPLTLAAHMQWQTLPPLSMTTPDVDLGGILEPAYEVGGDSFDFAFNDHVLHVAVFDAMGHGLEAATMATVIIAAYRHGRLAELPLRELYKTMDEAVATSFPGRFATAQLGRLNTETGVLSWVNAGHPPAMWVRGGRVIGDLTGPISRPVGFGAGTPVVQTVQLEPGDRVLFFTDGVVEERLPGGEQFGEERLRDLVEQTTVAGQTCAESVRRLSHALMAARSGRTSDDASLLILEWKSPPREDELDRDIPEATPNG